MEETTKLNYKGSNIAKAEQEYGVKFFNVIETLSGKKGENNIGMVDLLFLFRAGGGTEEQFDKRVVDDAEGIMLDIMEGLSESGFLGKKMKFDRTKAMTEIKKALKEAES